MYYFICVKTRPRIFIRIVNGFRKIVCVDDERVYVFQLWEERWEIFFCCLSKKWLEIIILYTTNNGNVIDMTWIINEKEHSFPCAFLFLFIYLYIAFIIIFIIAERQLTTMFNFFPSFLHLFLWNWLSQEMRWFYFHITCK